MISTFITARARRAIEADKSARIMAGLPLASEAERQAIITRIAKLEAIETAYARAAFSYRIFENSRRIPR